jgi:glucose/arabinose dehydrogenase
VVRPAFVRRGIWVVALAIGVALLGPSKLPPPAPSQASAAGLPTGFQEKVVFSGLTNPTNIAFAPGGQVFVAEKSGIIKVYDNLSDPTPSIFADLNVSVYNFWDRGLLGFALDPQFPTKPYVYALYSHDGDLSGTPEPKYGTAGVYSDPCPTPPGPTTDGCVTDSRLVRLTAVPSGSAYVMSGSQQILVEDWCDQFQTHSIGTIAFGADGALYASGGDGAGATFTDYGQRGQPLNPCGDPPGGVGAALTPPSAEGGSLRAQDLRTSGDPVGLDGSIIRVDSATGQALSTNPGFGNSDPNGRRIIAYGTRNPFRMTFRPGTNDLWIGDVGEITWEEIDRIPNTTDTVVNLGWPCFEGPDHDVSFDAANLTLCENLYTTPSAVTGPYYAYNHSAQVVPGEGCSTGSSSISGVAFESGGVYPAAYQGGLFFADYSRKCIWVMKKTGGPDPSPSSIQTFVDGAAGPVDLKFGPDGYLYYVDLDGGTIRRIEPFAGTPPPAGTDYLSDLAWTSMSNHCGPIEKDTSNGDCGAGDGVPMKINGVSYAKGLGAHAPSDVSYYLGGACTRFKASTGIDDEVPASNGSVTFQVYADSTLVYQSPILNGTSATQTVDVSVAGAQQLRLVLDPGADADWDHADWALARVDCGSGSDTTPPTVVGQSPTAGATGVGLTTNVTATFSEAMSASTLTTSTFTLVKQGTSTPLSATVSYASQVATLDPTTDLLPSTTYTATVKGGASGAKDAAGNALAVDVSWSFTTGAGGPTPPPAGTDYLSDLTWTAMTNHCGPVEKDMSNGNCGAGDGVPMKINGVSYAKGLGAHAPSDVSYYLGGACTRLKASIGIDDEVPTSNGSVVFRVFADSTRVFQSASLNGTSATVNVDVSVAGATTLRLNLNSGGNADWDHGDWALARVDCGSDTTPPTVTGKSPAPGATGVGPSTNVTATFSEAMNASTVTTSTFTLVKQGTTTPLSATVSYASQVATFDPTTDLLPATTYTATVKGGTSGAKDVAGNALAADVSWSFTTGAAANLPPTPVIDTPAVGTTWKVGDLLSFTGHATDPEQGALPASALSWSLVIQHCPSTCHTHPIQSWPGVSGASFNAPDHDYPSWLELTLTATDAAGSSASTTLRLDPKTVVLTFASAPTGLQLVVDSSAATTPFVRTVIVGGNNTISAVTPQTLLGTTYQFGSWSDSGAQTHDITAPASSATYTATYTTTADTTSPTITNQSPASGATGVGLSTNVTATFSEAMNPTTLTAATFTLVKQGTSTPLLATVSYASQVATLDPTTDLLPSTTYTATVTGGALGAKDVAGNALAADASWSFTTGTGGPSPPPAGTDYLSDLTWTAMTNFCGPVEKDMSNGNCGSGDGVPMKINGVAFAKGLGAHAASDVSYYLGGTCTRFKASIGIDDEVPGSNGSVVFSVYADSTRVFQSASLNGTSATVTVDVSVAGATTLRLNLDSGADANWDHADWALARVDCGSGSDTIPPTVTGQSPSAGAPGVAVATNVAATFSEAMNASTLTTSTFTLVQQGTSTPLPVTVSYASQVATLDPAADLLPSTTYTATVKGGASGVKDVAGNALAADVSWSFTTTATSGPPAGTSYLSDLTWTSMTNFCGPIEKDTSNGGCGAGDGQTLSINGVTYAKGLGAHANSDVTYFLGGACSRFKASIGIDDEVPASNGSVVFSVYADSTLVYQSASLNGTSATVNVDVSITGATTLRLNLDAGADADWDHADWALARVDC